MSATHSWLQGPRLPRGPRRDDTGRAHVVVGGTLGGGHAPVDDGLKAGMRVQAMTEGGRGVAGVVRALNAWVVLIEAGGELVEVRRRRVGQ